MRELHGLQWTSKAEKKCPEWTMLVGMGAVCSVLTGAYVFCRLNAIYMYIYLSSGTAKYRIRRFGGGVARRESFPYFFLFSLFLSLFLSFFLSFFLRGGGKTSPPKNRASLCFRMDSDSASPLVRSRRQALQKLEALCLGDQIPRNPRSGTSEEPSAGNPVLIGGHLP